MRALNIIVFPALAMVPGCSGETQAQAEQPAQTQTSDAVATTAATEAANPEDDAQPSSELILQSPVQAD